MPPIIPPQAGTHCRNAGRAVKCDHAARTRRRRRRRRPKEAHDAIARWVNEGGGGEEIES